MTGSITDGEDVVQDALFRAYRNLETWDDSRPLSPWIFRIAHNQCIDFLRSRGVRVEAEPAAAEPDFVEPGDPIGPPIGPAIEHLVLSLPPKERACVLLKDVFDYSPGEIAQLVDSTVGGVKAALNRGQSKLESLQTQPAAPRGPTPEKRIPGEPPPGQSRGEATRRVMQVRAGRRSRIETRIALLQDPSIGHPGCEMSLPRSANSGSISSNIGGYFSNISGYFR